MRRSSSPLKGSAAGGGGSSPSKRKLSISTAAKSPLRSGASISSTNPAANATTNQSSSSSSYGQPGFLHLYISHACHLPHVEGDSQWTVDLGIEVFNFKTRLDQEDNYGGRGAKWEKAISLSVHWSPSQIRVPLLQATVSQQISQTDERRASGSRRRRYGGVQKDKGEEKGGQEADDDARGAILFANLDLAPLFFKPLQLTTIQLPLTPVCDPLGAALVHAESPCLYIKILYTTTQSANSTKAGHLLERINEPIISATVEDRNPSGQLQIQLLSVTKLRRTCMQVVRPTVSFALLSPPSSSSSSPSVAQVQGKVSPFGEYGIYFDNAETSISIPTYSSGAPLVELILYDANKTELLNDEGDEEASAATPSHLGALGTVKLVLLDALAKVGHILDACYPLRAPGTCLKVADVRLTLHFVSSEMLAFVQRPLSLPPAALSAAEANNPTTGQEASIKGQRYIRIRLGALRGLYKDGFPGRKDPFVEFALLRPCTNEDDDNDEVASTVRSGLAGDGLENLVWDEVLHLPIPTAMDDQGGPWNIAIALRSAAVLGEEDGRDDLLGSAGISWPSIKDQQQEDQENHWYTLTHPDEPEALAGDLRIAYLGVTDNPNGADLKVMSDTGPQGSLSYLAPIGQDDAGLGGGIMTTATNDDGGKIDSIATPRRRLAPANRCAQLQPCGPGFILCRVASLQTISAGKVTESFQPDAIYIKVRPQQSKDSQEQHDQASAAEEYLKDLDRDSVFSESKDKAFDASNPSSSFKRKAYPLIGESSCKVPRSNATKSRISSSSQPSSATNTNNNTCFTAPACYGRQSIVRLYFGLGKNPHTRKWYRGSLHLQSAMAFPGREIQEWKLLTPVRRFAETDLGLTSPLPEHRRPSSDISRLGRAHILIRYIPHSVGNLSIALHNANLEIGPEAALSQDTSTSFLTNKLFVRTRLLPGGDLAFSSSRDVSLPASKGISKQDLSWNGEELKLSLDTTEVPLLKNIPKLPPGPSIELSVLNNCPVVENCLGRAYVSLADVLYGGHGKEGLDGETSIDVRLSLIHPFTEAEVGLLGITLKYSHLYTPAAALAATSNAVPKASGDGTTLSSTGDALCELKRLFYSLDRDGNHYVSQEELISYLDKPPAGGGQKEDVGHLLRDLMNWRQSDDQMVVTQAVRNIFTNIDVDSDGRLSWEEWVSFLDMVRLSQNSQSALDIGLIRQNAQAMKCYAHGGAAAPALFAAAAKDKKQKAQSSPFRQRKPARKTDALFTPCEGLPSALKLPMTLQTTALFTVDNLPLNNPSSSPVKLSASGRRGSMISTINFKAPARAPTSSNSSIDDVVEENNRLRTSLNKLKDDYRTLEARVRQEVDAEKAKVRKEMDIFVGTFQAQMASINASAGSSPSADSGSRERRQNVLKDGLTEEAGLLDLQMMNKALKENLNGLDYTLQNAKTERNAALTEVSLLRSKLEALEPHYLNEDAIKMELRRLEAAKTQGEKCRVSELRNFINDLSIAKQETEMVQKKLKLEKDISERTRKEVERLRALLEQEKKQSSDLQAVNKRLQSTLAVFERKQMKSRAVMEVKNKALQKEWELHNQYQERREMEELACHRAANLIQSRVKGYLARAKSSRQAKAFFGIQTIVRSFLRSRRLRLKAKARHEAAIVLQKAWRGFYITHCIRRWARSIICIQALIRGMLQRKKVLPWLHGQKKAHLDAVIKIQSQYRTMCAKQQLKQHRDVMRKDELLRKVMSRRISRSIMRWLLYRKNKSATVLQRANKKRYEAKKSSNKEDTSASASEGGHPPATATVVKELDSSVKDGALSPPILFKAPTTKTMDLVGGGESSQPFSPVSSTIATHGRQVSYLEISQAGLSTTPELDAAIKLYKSIADQLTRDEYRSRSNSVVGSPVSMNYDGTLSLKSGQRDGVTSKPQTPVATSGVGGGGGQVIKEVIAPTDAAPVKAVEQSPLPSADSIAEAAAAAVVIRASQDQTDVNDTGAGSSITGQSEKNQKASIEEITERRTAPAAASVTTVEPSRSVTESLAVIQEVHLSPTIGTGGDENLPSPRENSPPPQHQKMENGRGPLEEPTSPIVATAPAAAAIGPLSEALSSGDSNSMAEKTILSEDAGEEPPAAAAVAVAKVKSHEALSATTEKEETLSPSSFELKTESNIPLAPGAAAAAAASRQVPKDNDEPSTTIARAPAAAAAATTTTKPFSTTEKASNAAAPAAGATDHNNTTTAITSHMETTSNSLPPKEKETEKEPSASAQFKAAQAAAAIVEEQSLPLTTPLATSPLPAAAATTVVQERKEEASSLIATSKIASSDAYVGRRVRIKVAVDEQGEDFELFLGKVTHYDEAKDMLRVAFDDEPDFFEEFKRDSKEVEFLADEHDQVKDATGEKKASSASQVKAAGAAAGAEKELVVEFVAAAATGFFQREPLVSGANEVTLTSSKKTPQGKEAVGWEVRISLAGDEEGEEEFVGQVVGYDERLGGTLSILFDGMDEFEEINLEQMKEEGEVLEFVRKIQ